MGRPVLEIGSVTYAMKGRNILAGRGIACRVERIVDLPRTRGCSFGIYVPYDADRAEHILRQEGIPVVGRSERGAKP